MKQLIYLLCVLACVRSSAQTVYLADTAFVTDVGYGGAPTSCKTNGLTYNGVGMDYSQGNWVADAFTIPVGETWTFDTVIVYGYQFGSGTLSPFTACSLHIYAGMPGAGGTVIWGSASANVLSSAAFTGIFKVDTIASNGGLMSTKRPIMALRLHLSPAPTLTSGTYWLSWSVTGTSATNPPVCPYKVLPGRVNPTGQMARAFASGTWLNIVDNGQPIGFCKMITAKAGISGVEHINHGGDALLVGSPNPFSSSTILSFTLKERGNTLLTIRDVLGRVVATPVNAELSAGQHRILFNAESLPKGIYYCSLSAPRCSGTVQLILMR